MNLSVKTRRPKGQFCRLKKYLFKAETFLPTWGVLQQARSDNGVRNPRPRHNGLIFLSQFSCIPLHESLYATGASISRQLQPCQDSLHFKEKGGEEIPETRELYVVHPSSSQSQIWNLPAEFMADQQEDTQEEKLSNSNLMTAESQDKTFFFLIQIKNSAVLAFHVELGKPRCVSLETCFR